MLHSLRVRNGGGRGSRAPADVDVFHISHCKLFLNA